MFRAGDNGHGFFRQAKPSRQQKRCPCSEGDKWFGVHREKSLGALCPLEFNGFRALKRQEVMGKAVPNAGADARIAIDRFPQTGIVRLFHRAVCKEQVS